MPEVSTLILTAVELELKPVIRRLELKREGRAGGPLWRGAFLDRRIAAAATGIGRRRAAQTTQLLLDVCRPQRVLITGTAGAIDPDLRAGDLVIPSLVVDAATDQRLVPTLDAPMHGTLVTMDRIVASPADKSRLYHEQQVTAVDMETAGIAQVCAGNSVPWLCVRAVLDRADQVLPGALVGLTRADGRASFPAAVLYALTRPWRVPLLLGLPRRVRAAMQAATEQLVPWL